MGYASLQGHAIANPDAPTAAGTCDRCAGIYQHSHLRWQYDYRGRNLSNLRILVCERCEDEPQNQLRPRIIPPDPMPIINARPFPYCEAEVDDRVTTNPALRPVSLATSANTLLSGLQFIDGEQVQPGELVLVRSQTNSAQNGIYKASTGIWSLQAYDNDLDTYIHASTLDTTWSGGLVRYAQLGMYLGTVYVSRGLQAAKLFQIDYADPSASVSAGTTVSVTRVTDASAVNRYDFWTGIYMEGRDYVRVTQEGYVRTPQQVGQAAGNLNEIPGYSNLVPGSCDIGQPTQAPYGCATRQGLPPSMDTLPFAGALWPTLQNQSIGVWLSNSGLPSVWVNALNVQVTFKSLGFWPNPGPGAPYRPVSYQIDYSTWVTNFGVGVNWNNTLAQTVFWSQRPAFAVFPPGGDVLWRDVKCVLTLWHNAQGNNVNFAEIYPNAIKPNKPGPWPFGWT